MEQILEQMALLLVWKQNWEPFSIKYDYLLDKILEEFHMPAAKFWQEMLKTPNKGLIERLRELTPNPSASCLCFEKIVVKQILEKLLKTESLKFWNEESESRRNSHITRDLELSVSTD